MATKTITCRAHGGTFEIEARRGRPPVSCTTENSCTVVARTAANIKAGKSSRPRNEVSVKAERDAEAIAAAKRKAAQNATAAAKQVSVALDKALAAKARLEPLGWRTVGTKDGTDVVLSASRDDERMMVRWNAAGELLAQEYSLWDMETTKRNSKPPSRLPFDPDDISDRELIRMLSGTKVTWWNALAQAYETEIVSPDKVQVSHNYDGHGDEQPADRVLTFVAVGGGFRSFRLGALIKVG